MTAISNFTVKYRIDSRQEVQVINVRDLETVFSEKANIPEHIRNYYLSFFRGSFTKGTLSSEAPTVLKGFMLAGLIPYDMRGKEATLSYNEIESEYILSDKIISEISHPSDRKKGLSGQDIKIREVLLERNTSIVDRLSKIRSFYKGDMKAVREILGDVVNRELEAIIFGITDQEEKMKVATKWMKLGLIYENHKNTYDPKDMSIQNMLNQFTNENTKMHEIESLVQLNILTENQAQRYRAIIRGTNIPPRTNQEFLYSEYFAPIKSKNEIVPKSSSVFSEEEKLKLEELRRILVDNKQYSSAEQIKALRVAMHTGLSLEKIIDYNPDVKDPDKRSLLFNEGKSEWNWDKEVRALLDGLTTSVEEKYTLMQNRKEDARIRYQKDKGQVHIAWDDLTERDRDEIISVGFKYECDQKRKWGEERDTLIEILEDTKKEWADNFPHEGNVEYERLMMKIEILLSKVKSHYSTLLKTP